MGFPPEDRIREYTYYPGVDQPHSVVYWSKNVLGAPISKHLLLRHGPAEQRRWPDRRRRQPGEPLRVRRLGPADQHGRGRSAAAALRCADLRRGDRPAEPPGALVRPRDATLRQPGPDRAGGGIDPYAYAGNDPVQFGAPSGLLVEPGNCPPDWQLKGECVVALDGVIATAQLPGLIFWGYLLSQARSPAWAPPMSPIASPQGGGEIREGKHPNSTGSRLRTTGRVLRRGPGLITRPPYPF